MTQTQLNKINRGITYVFVFALTVFITFVLNDSSRLRNKMVKLNTEVIELKVANQNLMKERAKLKDSLQYVWDEMDRITHVEQLLIDENRILEDEIEKLKPKYEQIKRSVPRLTADSIRRYFTNL